ncbi:MAG: tetratricopeptide repeat protein [Rhodovibrionaceae bacterium]
MRIAPTLTSRAAAALLAFGLAFGTAGGTWAMGSDSSTSSASDSSYATGEELIAQGDYAAAIEELGVALEESPQNADVLNYLGYAHRKLGNYGEAEDYYLRALEIEPEHKGANEYLGELYLETGRPELAEERLEVLDGACFFGCEEYDALKQAIEAHKAAQG